MKRKMLSILLCLLILGAILLVRAAGEADAASMLFDEINASRMEVEKPALARDAGLDKLAAAYACILCDAGGEFRKTTDFKTLPNGEKVISLAKTHGVAVSGFSYSVFFGANAELKATTEFRNKAVHGDFSRVGVACLNGADGSYVTVLVYDNNATLPEGSLAPPITAKQHTDLEQIVSLSPRSTVLVIKDDGSVWQSTDILDFDRYPLTQVWDQAKAVWRQEFVCYLLDESDTLWGQGGNRATPVGRITDIYFPESSHEFTPVLSDVRLFRTGVCSLAVKHDGSLWMWGHIPSCGKIMQSQDHVILEPYHVMDDVQQIALGQNFGLAVKSDETLWSWYGSVDEHTGKVDCTTFQIMDNVAFAEDGMVVKNDGSLWQLVADESSETPIKPVKLLSNITAVSGGGYFYTALDKTGQVWAWPIDSINPSPEVVAVRGKSLVKSWFHDTLFYIDSNDSLQAVVRDGSDIRTVLISDQVIFSATSMDRILLFIKNDGSLWRTDLNHLQDDEKERPAVRITDDFVEDTLRDIVMKAVKSK